VHRVDGDDHPSQVEQAQKPLHSRDLVAFRGHRDLSEYGTGSVVERGDQARDALAAAAGATDGLTVDRDHPAPAGLEGAGPHERSEDLVHGVGVNAGERPTDRGLLGASAGHAQRGQRVGRLVGGSLSDGDERAGTGQHPRQPDRQDRRQAVAHAAWVTRVGHRPQQRQQVRSLRSGRVRRGCAGGLRHGCR